ncbi:MAG: DUF1302 domain-containing protein [Rhodocyclaceae bacterium]|nr:DUF1302 domain-containing protein [Rhodocyclaceae bacterium]
MTKLHIRWRSIKVATLVVSACCTAATAHAFKFETAPDWEVNLDNSIAYSMGWRMQEQDSRILNHTIFSAGDAKFSKGDMVTNRISDLIEFQAVYQGKMGFRTSASIWKDFAYNDNVKLSPAVSTALGGATSYTNNKYSNTTKRYFMEGGEFLDAFVFLNAEVGGTPVYAKAGRLTQYWGNSFFFGFSNIAYSQSPIDYIKGFSQPGSEIKELFMPRKQILLAADISPELSVAAQYFFEYRPNRYPEAGTYLGFFDILFNGPQMAIPVGLIHNNGIKNPKNNNGNWGLKVSWAPDWVGGDLGFYYRQFDEVHPWLAGIDPSTTAGGAATMALFNPVAQKAKLFGISFEKSFGLLSLGLELNQRRHTALYSFPLLAADEGARGTITNFIANTLVQVGTTPLWDSGIFIAELSYTHLNSVTSNAGAYFGLGTANCLKNFAGPGGTWRDGCATNNSLAIAMLFDPQWLQVYPGIDIDMPMSYTWGAHGNPAYAASPFYAQGTNIYSIGVKATYQQKHSLSLTYSGYNWRTNGTGDTPAFQGVGTQAYSGFGGAGAPSLNDRGWLQLQYKTSF